MNARPTPDEWIARLPELKRVGQEHVGPCPLCGGTDRFRVGERGAFCRQCCPNGGREHRDQYWELVKAVFGEDAPQRPAPPPRPPKTTSRTQSYALRIVAESTAIKGTLAERYLVGRGLGDALEHTHTDALRFHPNVRVQGAAHPALVAVVTEDHGGKPVAAHCVLLNAEGGKADIDVPKRSFGPVSQGAAYLGREHHVIALLAEGVENALAAHVLIGDGHPIAALGTGRLGNWSPPKWCKGVHLVADTDAAGYKAASRFLSRMNNAGVPAKVRWLSEGDANDLLDRSDRP